MMEVDWVLAALVGFFLLVLMVFIKVISAVIRWDKDQTVEDAEGIKSKQGKK